MTGLIYFLLGAGVGGGAVCAFHHFCKKPSGGQMLHGGQTSPSVLHGKIVAIPTSGNPAPDTLLPMAGYASHDLYEWGYVVGPGDTPGDIARAITGDDSRYQDLLAANPDIATIGEIGVFSGDGTWQFKTDATVPIEKRFAPGTPILLPVPWARYIDQLGNPRGGTTPFPPDPRAATSAKVSGRYFDTKPKELSPRKPAAASPIAANGDGYSPYGELVTLEQIPVARKVA